MTDKDDELHSRIKQTLDASLEGMDQESARRLRLARAAAIDAAVKPRRAKFWLDAALIGSVAALAVALWLVTPEQAQLAPAFDDLELLAGSEEPEFYQELDFYYWLEQQHEQG